MAHSEVRTCDAVMCEHLCACVVTAPRGEETIDIVSNIGCKSDKDAQKKEYLHFRHLIKALVRSGVQ